MFSRLVFGAKVMVGWEQLKYSNSGICCFIVVVVGALHALPLSPILFQWAQANFGGRLTICLRTLTWTGKEQECFRIFIEFSFHPVLV